MIPYPLGELALKYTSIQTTFHGVALFSTTAANELDPGLCWGDETVISRFNVHVLPSRQRV
jgi:hypothetical protein